VRQRTWFQIYEEFVSGAVHPRRHPRHSWAEDFDPSLRLVKFELDDFLHRPEFHLCHRCARGLTEGE